MKKLLYLLIAITLMSCSKKNEEPSQGYTSFVFVYHVDVNFPNCVAGYKTAEGKYKKLGDLGDLSKDKYSNEIRVLDENVTTIYFFTDYFSPRRLDAEFKLKKNMKNVFTISEDTKGISVDKSDDMQYPH